MFEKERFVDMYPISLCIIARNASNLLENCLRNVRGISDEIIILDTGSSDNTPQKAREMGAKVIEYHWRMDFADARNTAMDASTNDWLLWIDTDEYYPAELIEEIKKSLSNRNCSGYRIPRKNYFFGSWLKHGGNYPDYQMKLFRKSSAERFRGRVHESIKIKGAIGKLKNPCEHLSYPSVDSYLRKFGEYSSIQALMMHENGMRVNVVNSINYLLVKPLFRFIRRYIFKGGFRDGYPGLLACLFDFCGYIVRYAKLWEINKQKH
ncbi:MAG: glycosyltransferase [candidate division Zixibacteria bacterium]|nr:glycosyltransferase [candidate division Zixibacteria bacterium]